MECEHGWRDAADCDTCTAIRVAPKAMERIAELEAALRDIIECEAKEPHGDKCAADMTMIARNALKN